MLTRAALNLRLQFRSMTQTPSPSTLVALAVLCGLLQLVVSLMIWNGDYGPAIVAGTVTALLAWYGFIHARVIRQLRPHIQATRALRISLQRILGDEENLHLQCRRVYYIVSTTLYSNWEILEVDPTDFVQLEFHRHNEVACVVRQWAIHTSVPFSEYRLLSGHIFYDEEDQARLTFRELTLPTTLARDDVRVEYATNVLAASADEINRLRAHLACANVIT